MEAGETAANGGKPPAIDFHAHFLDERVLELAQRHSLDDHGGHGGAIARRRMK